MWSGGRLLLPLLVLIVPVSREALHWVDPHVQHPLQLLRFELLIEGVWNSSIDCTGGRRTVPRTQA